MELFIGSHLSTTGGWNALLKRSHDEGGTAFAFFPRSPYGKRSKALDPTQAAEFGARLKAQGYGPLVVHAPYVYNLAGKDEAKRQFAIEALIEDIELLTPIREAGQETYINIHPGSHVGQGAETGCQLISEGLNQVFERANGIPVLLETMAGKGTECGRSFEELATIMNDIDNKANVGITFDTCHVLDAGYDLVNHYDDVMNQLDEIIGFGKVKAIHMNDSQFGLGSHKDRHANIGEGQLGIPFFTRLVNDPMMAKLPMILETKEQTPNTHRDEIALLRSLVK
ncbi:deoxyribonuclease IV [Bifidobacterium imperatoris]|uniref:Probable endonuclease 4 n=1 Tax=Bifidobacterium imperatoris TaxID=2020965 RepID=A0A2N5IS26_9BIFI|nr:deoxyribonuclease IV [Bifidobacterium imperatoris]PLS24747.1 endonuclease IV [Bifidobacterium imperatoris]QSY57527.1 deoxyribonuclease IV [Bifidobacterium imperatoris]